MKKNYHKMTEDIIKENQDNHHVPTLLLHSCCAPCSSAVLEWLGQHFKISIFFYNPNITESEEYDKRVKEQQYFIEKINPKYPVAFLEGNYDIDKYITIAKPYAEEKEGGKRCEQCYHLRLKETAEVAQKLGFDYFTTTLSISPMKNAQLLNEIGEALENDLEVKYLYSDFKKKERYKRSIEMSKEYNLYRQDYCGCVYSKQR